MIPDKLTQILVELTDALSFDHSKKANEAFRKAYEAINELIIKAGVNGIDKKYEFQIYCDRCGKTDECFKRENGEYLCRKCAPLIGNLFGGF